MTETTRKRLWNTTILLPVFIPAFFFILLLVIGTASQPDLAGELFSSLLAYITSSFGWFYMLAGAILLVCVVIGALSRGGDVQLGPGHSAPQCGFPAWFARLCSAGYGIALLFFGVAEPVLHYADPPVGAGLTVDAAKQ